jgi:hypothetical protein
MANTKEKVPVSFKLDEDIRDLAAQVARAKGIDLSEHVRSLVLEDLDRRGLLAGRIRMQVSVRFGLPQPDKQQAPVL